MNTSLKKTLIEGVIAQLAQFNPNHCFIVIYLRFIFNCCVRYLTHIKIGGEYVIKKRWPEVLMQLKIGGEYIIKKR